MITQAQRDAIVDHVGEYSSLMYDGEYDYAREAFNRLLDYLDTITAKPLAVYPSHVVDAEERN